MLAPDSRPRTLGRSTLRVFPIAYGCWRFAGTDVATARDKVEAALELGIDLFDHADIYGDGQAEELFGRVLAEDRRLRDRMTIATKGGIIPGVPYDSSPEHLTATCERSLKRLQVDTIDLYQIHRPDFLGHPEQVAATLSKLREQGKIREVGVSNHTPSQLRALQAWLPFPIATRQPEFSCWRHEPLRDGTLDQCLELRITPLAWSPMAGGRLGMNPCDAEDPRLRNLLGLLDEIACSQQASRGAVAIAWTMLHPSGVIPILGTQRIDRIREGVSALKVRLSRTQWNAILVAAQGEPLP